MVRNQPLIPQKSNSFSSATRDEKHRHCNLSLSLGQSQHPHQWYRSVPCRPSQPRDIGGRGEDDDGQGASDDEESNRGSDGRNHMSTSSNNHNAEEKPFEAQLTQVLDLLQSNLDPKAKLYEDVALNSFLMNNGRYVVQKIKGSSEINQLLGNTLITRLPLFLISLERELERKN